MATLTSNGGGSRVWGGAIRQNKRNGLTGVYSNSATIFRFSPRIATGVRNSSRSGHQAETVILQARGPRNDQSVAETHDELTPQGNTASHADDRTNHPEVPVAYQGDKPESVRVAMRRAMDRTW